MDSPSATSRTHREPGRNSLSRLLSGIVPMLLAGVMISCSGQEAGTKRDRSASLDFSESVSFLDYDGNVISSIKAAVADDATEQSLGLMFVYTLEPDQGMIFLFPNEEPRSFWMANTPLPLDIIYVDEEFTIVSIHRNTPPFSQENFVSGDPARYVVEVNGGYTIQHDIREGMRVRFGS